MRVDPEAKFGSSFQLNKKRYNPAYSRSYYLLINDGKKYEAYILTIIADSTYLNNDLSKLDHNTYRKHDADFSGTILYFTPRGSYLGGYGYHNGQLMASGEEPQTDKKPQIQSLANDRLIANTVKQECTDWYVVYYVDGVYQYDEYLTTTCVNVDDGNTPGSGGSAPPPPPPPCPPGTHVGPPVTPPCIPVAVESVGGNQVKTNYVPPPPPPGGGGMPPPPTQVCSVDPPREPCPENDPCKTLKDAKQKFATTFNTQRNAAVLAKPGTNEYGSNLNLTSLTSTTYKNTPITTFGVSSWTSNFTWNSNDGYTIGTVHRHQAAGPSPNDVFELIDHLSNSALITSGATSIKFYRDNAYTTVVSNTTTYTVTVSNWGLLSQMFQDYNQNRAGYEETFASRATNYQTAFNIDAATATTKVLMEIFGGAINLYKAPNSSTNYVITDIDKNGNITIKTCPD